MIKIHCTYIHTTSFWHAMYEYTKIFWVRTKCALRTLIMTRIIINDFSKLLVQCSHNLIGIHLWIQIFVLSTNEISQYLWYLTLHLTINSIEIVQFRMHNFMKYTMILWEFFEISYSIAKAQFIRKLSESVEFCWQWVASRSFEKYSNSFVEEMTKSFYIILSNK